VTIPQPIGRSDWRALYAILALALALRLYELGSCLWYDEVDTLVSHTRPAFSHLLTHLPSFNHHVFFSLQAKASIALFGETAFAVRLPAALLGVGSVAALWLVAREMSTLLVAHGAALLMAVSYHHVWFSQNARGYTGMLFWGLLSALFYLRGMRATSLAASRRSAVGLAVAAALMLYTHLSASFLLTALGLVHLGTLGLAWRRGASPERLRLLLWVLGGFAGGAGLALLLFVPIIPDVLATLASTSASTQGSGAQAKAISHWNSPLWMVKEVLSTFSGLGPLVALGALGVLSVLGAGMLATLRRGQWALAATFLIHVPLTLLILKLLAMRVWPRFFFLDIGFICLFLVEGAMAIGALGDRLLVRLIGRSLGAVRLGVAFSAIGVLGSLALLPKNYRHPKQDLLGARDHVEKNRKQGSEVVALGLVSAPFEQYYAPSWKAVASLEQLVAIEHTHREVWLVYSFPQVTKKRFPAVMTRLQQSFVRQKVLPGTLGDGDVYVFRSK
jgi:uncharacterized membrane protein